MLAELAKARLLVNEGCYECLQEALDTYERALATTNPPADTAQGAFDTALLLALRMKELGLPDTAALEKARALATRVTPRAGRLTPSAYLDALALIGGELSGVANDEREQRQTERRKRWPRDDSLPAARAALEPAVATDLIAQYLALAVDCENRRGRGAFDADEVRARYPLPIIRYRLALCGVRVEALRTLRDTDPGWTDTFFFDGRFEMGKFPAPDVGVAAELFLRAHDAFPQSAAITLALANARNALSEYETALALFDEMLLDQPSHREALLGRVMSLSYLGRHFDGIRTASRMIELGTFHIGDAYYWRAWNRYHVHELPSAWADVEEATKLLVNTSVYTLAGFIAYARSELDTAIDRFVQAYKMDATNCEAVWTEAVVHVDQQSWAASAARFAVAVTCFAAAADQARFDIDTARNAKWAEAVKARRLAAAEKRLATAEHRRAQAAFNAASSHLRLGEKAQALQYAGIAADHPLLKEKAAALQATVARLPK